MLLAAAGFTGWYVGRRAQRAARRRARRRLPADYFAGLNYLINEQPDRAVEVFTRMVDVDKETVEIHFALGSLFRRRGEVDRAIRVHQSILDRPKLDPEQRELALQELAVDYLRAGLLDHSETSVQVLAESDSHRLTALRSLTRIYEQQRDWQQAIVTHRMLAANGGPAQASAVAHYYCELAEAARMQGELDEARAHLRDRPARTATLSAGRDGASGVGAGRRRFRAGDETAAHRAEAQSGTALRGSAASRSDVSAPGQS